MPSIKKYIFGVFVFGLGSLTGYVLTKRLMKEQYQADLADIQRFYKEKLDELGVMPADFDPNAEEESSLDDTIEDEPEEDPEEEMTTIHYDYSKGLPRFNYNKPSLDRIAREIAERAGEEQEDEGDEEDVEEDEDEPSDPDYEEDLERRAEEYAKTRAENMKNGEPYVIESEEYEYGPEDYEKQLLFYYSEDRTLCDGNDTIIEDEEESVGFDYEDVFDTQTTAWVRNDKLRALYEIYRIDESYSKSVRGVVETPREREFRLKSRIKRAMDD